MYFTVAGNVTETVPLAAVVIRSQHAKSPVGNVSVSVETSDNRYSVLFANLIDVPLTDETSFTSSCRDVVLIDGVPVMGIVIVSTDAPFGWMNRAIICVSPDRKYVPLL